MKAVVHVPLNADRGYGHHIRMWTLPPPRSTPPSLPSDVPHLLTVTGSDDSDEAVDSSEDSDTDLHCQRELLSAEPSLVLLNLTDVTKKIFGYLPIPALRHCTKVCRSFHSLAKKEIQLRNDRISICTRRLSAGEATTSITDIIFNRWEDSPCEPSLIIFFKNRSLLSSSHKSDLRDRIEPGMFLHPQPRQLIGNLSILCHDIFATSSDSVGFQSSFAAVFIPRISGLIVRQITYENHVDHALRIGHFSLLRNCMDDLSATDVKSCEAKGFFLATSAYVLGVPEPIVFKAPFCSLKTLSRDELDRAYVFCGQKVACASVWFDSQIHRKSSENIAKEFEKINPEKLLKDVKEAFAFYFTTTGSALLGSREEIAMFRKLFPKVKLVRCTVTESLFGNTASSVCATSEADCTVKFASGASSTQPSPGKAMFFIVAVCKDGIV